MKPVQKPVDLQVLKSDIQIGGEEGGMCLPPALLFLNQATFHAMML